jgi:hypothetical protein
MFAGFAFSLVLNAQSGVTLPPDNGPSRVDVSAYPAETQKDYKVFVAKCSKCHTIARPINTLMTWIEWERYVQRMMHKPNSGISENDARAIYNFLRYDEITRKDPNPKAFFRALSDKEIEELKAQH